MQDRGLAGTPRPVDDLGLAVLEQSQQFDDVASRPGGFGARRRQEGDRRRPPEAPIAWTPRSRRPALWIETVAGIWCTWPSHGRPSSRRGRRADGESWPAEVSPKDRTGRLVGPVNRSSQAGKRKAAGRSSTKTAPEEAASWIERSSSAEPQGRRRVDPREHVIDRSGADRAARTSIGWGTLSRCRAPCRHSADPEEAVIGSTSPIRDRRRVAPQHAAIYWCDETASDGRTIPRSCPPLASRRPSRIDVPDPHILMAPQLGLLSARGIRVPLHAPTIAHTDGRHRSLPLLATEDTLSETTRKHRPDRRTGCGPTSRNRPVGPAAWAAGGHLRSAPPRITLPRVRPRSRTADEYPNTDIPQPHRSHRDWPLASQAAVYAPRSTGVHDHVRVAAGARPVATANISASSTPHRTQYVTHYWPPSSHLRCHA